MRRLPACLMIFVAIQLVGCASVPYMPLADDSARVDTSRPLYLMSVVLKNEYRPRWQPRVLNIILANESGTEKPDLLAFRMDSKGAIKPENADGSTTYLVRFTAESTRYSVRGFNAMASAFPVHTFYNVPLHANVPSFDTGVYYLGAVTAVIRERQDKEFRAGPVMPLIDQAVGGASTGTFDIEIIDSYISDMELFKKTFTALKDIEVQSAVLSKWDRSKAQLFWERN